MGRIQFILAYVVKRSKQWFHHVDRLVMTQRVFTVVLLSFIILAAIILLAAIRLIMGYGDFPPTFSTKSIEGETISAGVGGRPEEILIASPPTPIVMHIATDINPVDEASFPLPTIPPWPTLQNTPTAIPTPLATVIPPQQVPLNGVAWTTFIVIPPDVKANARQIFRTGQSMGRNPSAYSKVGDSTVENPHFMTRFDEGPYNLGPYSHLQPVIDAFHGSHARDSLAVQIGLHSWSANDPMWGDPAFCLPAETPIQCEIRIHNPAILLIRLGTNDVGTGNLFAANIRHIVETAIAAGVIPVIGTKGDRHEGSNENNEILRQIAAEYRIPLWDYDRIADTLPGRGLDQDAVHMLSFFAHDYNDPVAFTRGHAMHNLSALMMLDAVWREVILSGNEQ